MLLSIPSRRTTPAGKDVKDSFEAEVIDSSGPDTKSANADKVNGFGYTNWLTHSVPVRACAGESKQDNRPTFQLEKEGEKQSTIIQTHHGEDCEGQYGSL